MDDATVRQVAVVLNLGLRVQSSPVVGGYRYSIIGQTVVATATAESCTEALWNALARWRELN